MDAPRAVVFTGPGAPLELRPSPRVHLAEGEVRVRVRLSAICGSDLRTLFGQRPAPVPSVLGHEAIGLVVEAAPGAPAVAREGARVAWSIAASCGACGPCERGLTQKCARLFKYGHEAFEPGAHVSGGYADEVVLRAGTHVVALPEGVPDAAFASVGCAGATAAACLRTAGSIAGADVLIVGAGALGLFACAMASASGARHVIALEARADRRALALLFGATDAVDPAATPIAATRARFDVALELSGAAPGVERAVDAIGLGGRCILAGTVGPTPAVALDAEALVRRLGRIEGVHNYVAADLDAAVRFIADHGARFPIAGLVGKTFPLDAIDAAVALAAEGTHPRVALRP